MRDDRIKAVSVLDPALDMTADEILEYAKSRDIKLVRQKPGERATVFHIREVPHALWESWIMAADNDAEIARRCFQAGVFKVEHLYSRDGVRTESWEPGGDRIDDESLERFSPAERIEIGQVVWDHSFLHPRIAPTYRLPPTSVSSLTRRDFRRADASPSGQAPSSGEASPEPGSVQPQHPPTVSDSSESAASSDSPTDATATATT